MKRTQGNSLAGRMLSTAKWVIAVGGLLATLLLAQATAIAPSAAQIGPPPPAPTPSGTPIPIPCTPAYSVTCSPPPKACPAYAVDMVTTGGIDDNFAGATEPTNVAPELQTALTNSGYIPATPRAFDEQTRDRYFLHRFDNLTIPAGHEICAIDFEARISYLHGNDNLTFAQTTPTSAQTGSFDAITGAQLSFYGIALNNTQVINLDLTNVADDNPATSFNLAPAIEQNGYLDIISQDDSPIDYATLTISHAPTCGTTRTFCAPVPMCAGVPVTVQIGLGQSPTANADVILGTPGNDTIAAGRGDDLICGLDGDDTIWGQLGNDTIYGNDGDDKLRGSAGDDTIFGGAGRDDISGGSDNDTVNGEAGDDHFVRGGTGDDIVTGGDGDDAIVSGNGGSDLVYGGPGNDKVIGGPRPDEVYGNDGNDIVRGHKGADKLFGGLGDDDIRGGLQPDDLDGGPGTDSCDGGLPVAPALLQDTAVNCEVVTTVP